MQYAVMLMIAVIGVAVYAQDKKDVVKPNCETEQ